MSGPLRYIIFIAWNLNLIFDFLAQPIEIDILYTLEEVLIIEFYCLLVHELEMCAVESRRRRRGFLAKISRRRRR